MTNKVNGMYKVQFQTPLGDGAGVIILNDGKVHGGDSMIYYHGTYTLEGDKILAQVSTNVHSNAPGMFSVFGKNNVTINLEGIFAGDKATLVGKSREAANVPFQAILTKLAA